jgi:hypothetical protein
MHRFTGDRPHSCNRENFPNLSQDFSQFGREVSVLMFSPLEMHAQLFAFLSWIAIQGREIRPG